MDTKIDITLPPGFDGSKPITILFGDSQKPVDPKGFSYSGSLDAPSTFLKVNKENILEHQAVIVMDFKETKITLDTDPSSPLNRNITGSLTKNPEITSLGINNQEKRYKTVELKNTLRKIPHLFESNDEYLAILKVIEELRVQLTVNHVQTGDTKGNLEQSIRKATNIEQNPTFKLKMPVYSGYEAKTFRVEIGLDVTDATVSLYLDSVDLILLEKQIRDEKFNEQSAEFAGYVVIRK